MPQTANPPHLVDVSKLAVWCRHCNDFSGVTPDPRSPSVLDCVVCGQRIGHTQWKAPVGRFRRLVERGRSGAARGPGER